MLLNPHVFAKKSSGEVWNCKLFNERQLLSPSEKSSPLWLSVQELLSSSLLTSVNTSSCLAGKAVQISVGGVVFKSRRVHRALNSGKTFLLLPQTFLWGLDFSLVTCMRYSTVPL